MSQKTVSEWTASDVKAWIMTIPCGSNMKNAACTVADENALTGQDLANVSSSQELKDCGFNGIIANKMFNALASLKSTQTPQQQQYRANKANATQNRLQQLLAQNQQKKKTQQMLNNNNNNNNNNNSINNSNSVSAFQVTIVKGSITKKTQGYFELYQKVVILKRHIADTEGGDMNLLRLVCNGKPLQDDKTLGMSKVDAVTPVNIIFRVVGGAQLANNNNNNNNDSDTRERVPDLTNKNIQGSIEPDCIMGYDEQDQLRVKMPCNHVFDPTTIYELIKMTMKDHHRTAVKCPMEKCGIEWKFGDIVSAGDLNQNEQNNLASVIANRKLLQSGNYKKCPNCSAIVEKSDELYMLRVRCVSDDCKASTDFCWLCQQSWIGGGFAVCGNKDCHTATVNEELKNCGTTRDVMSRNDVDCPKTRACPRCLALVQYERACKHMKCWSCQEFFCFICLALGHKNPNNPAYASKWDCETGDSHSGECKLAPVQNVK